MWHSLCLRWAQKPSSTQRPVLDLELVWTQTLKYQRNCLFRPRSCFHKRGCAQFIFQTTECYFTTPDNLEPLPPPPAPLPTTTIPPLQQVICVVRTEAWTRWEETWDPDLLLPLTCSGPQAVTPAFLPSAFWYVPCGGLHPWFLSSPRLQQFLPFLCFFFLTKVNWIDGALLSDALIDDCFTSSFQDMFWSLPGTHFSWGYSK